MAVADQFTDPVCRHGEGPVWSPRWGGLRWVDLLEGDVLGLDADGAVQRWHVGSIAAALRPRRGGGAVIATEHEVLIADEIGGALRVLARPVDDPGIRFNDGACDPAGRFLCGTMAYAETPGAAALYRMDADGRVEAVLTDLTISNGLSWTADQTQVYYIDTPTGRIDVFDSDETGELRNRRPFVAIDAADGYPDGLCVDADGGVWVALWNGFAVRHYDAAGRLADVIEVPARNVTACTFGGADLDQLFITTSRKGDDDPHPTAGALFSYRPGLTGVPVLEFG